jgi:PAS domain S-box-containing protein
LPITVGGIQKTPFDHLVEAVGDYAIFLLDPHGRITTWNAGAQLIKGYRAEEIIGHHFSRFYPAEVAARGWPEEELRRAAAEGRIEDEGWRVRKDGSQFWAVVVITAIRGPNGELQGFLKITRDLTRRKQAEEALRQSEERFRLMVENVKDYAIFMLDPEGRVITWNAGAERINGYQTDEILGRHFSIFYPREQVDRGWPERELAGALETGRFEDEGWRLRKDGSRFWANVVITALRDAAGDLRGFSKVTRDLTDQKRAEEELRRANEDLEQRVEQRTAELREADRRKDEFLATLAHELRNPLAPLSNSLQIMRLAGNDLELVAKSRSVMERQLAHLIRLVDDLLDVSRISRGKIELRRERIDLSAVVGLALESCRPLIDRAGHTLTVSQPQPVFVHADRTRLAQVVSNLLTNATKYTERGGHIWLSTAIEGNEAVIRVKDNGIGIPPSMLSAVFEMFTQVDRSLERSQGGLGVGLSIVRRLVKMHGGHIEAFSEGVNCGSEFTVRLPLAQDAAQAQPSQEPHSAAVTQGRRILVADDNVDSAVSLAMVLKRLGNEVRTAHDGEEALEIAVQLRPEVVLLDIGMPKLNGFEVAKQIREQEWGQTVTLIALSGWGQEEDRRRSKEAGFDYHLIKPVEIAHLEKLLASLVAG